MSSRSADAGSSRGARKPTPTSPSPSPEPQGGASGGAAGPSGSSSIDANNPFLMAADPAMPALSPGTVPFYELLKALDGEDTAPPASEVADDPTEQARQRLEDSTRSVIDSLYQVAVCASDVQPGREDLVPAKINETIAHLATMFQQSVDGQDILPHVPEEVIEAVDEGKNPDAVSKARMARLVSDNQQLAGQRWAIEQYRQHLTSAVADLFPELEDPLVDLELQHRMQRTRPEGAPRWVYDLEREGEGSAADGKGAGNEPPENPETAAGSQTAAIKTEPSLDAGPGSEDVEMADVGSGPPPPSTSQSS